MKVVRPFPTGGHLETGKELRAGPCGKVWYNLPEEETARRGRAQAAGRNLEELVSWLGSRTPTRKE